MKYRPLCNFACAVAFALICACDDSGSAGSGSASNSVEEEPLLPRPVVSAEATTLKMIDCIDSKKPDRLSEYCTDEDARVIQEQMKAAETDPVRMMELMAVRNAEVVQEEFGRNTAFVTIRVDSGGAREEIKLPYENIDGKWKLAFHKSMKRMKMIERVNAGAEVRKALFRMRKEKGGMPSVPGVAGLVQLVQSKLLLNSDAISVSGGLPETEDDTFWAYLGANMPQNIPGNVPILIEKSKQAVASGHLVVVCADGSTAQISCKSDLFPDTLEALKLYAKSRGADPLMPGWNTAFRNAQTVDRASLQ